MVTKFKSNIHFSCEIAELLQKEAVQIAIGGGVQAIGSREKAKNAARKIIGLLDSSQKEEIQRFINRDTCLMVFTGLYDRNIDGSKTAPPDELPSLKELETDLECIKLGSVDIQVFSVSYPHDQIYSYRCTVGKN